MEIWSAEHLIDCGLFQGAETAPEGAGPNNLAIDFPIDHIRALVVTHVHTSMDLGMEVAIPGVSSA